MVRLARLLRRVLLSDTHTQTAKMATIAGRHFVLQCMLRSRDRVDGVLHHLINGLAALGLQAEFDL